MSVTKRNEIYSTPLCDAMKTSMQSLLALLDSMTQKINEITKNATQYDSVKV